MEKISRRAALKKIAGTSLFAATAPLFPAIVGCCRNRQPATLNVVLHGLFVLNFTNLNCELYTPFVEDHVYRAGNFEANGLQHLHPQMVYTLRGVSHISGAPKYDQTYDIYVDKARYNHVFRPQYSVFLIELPFPETIRLVRTVSGDPNNYCGDTGVFAINRLSLCQVLSYFVPDIADLELSGTGWKPYLRPDTGTVNLHIWAEPLQRMTYNHAYRAYQTLSGMFTPMRFQLNVNRTAPLDTNTGIYGLRPEEEMGLSEWASAGEGSYPTNCSVVSRG